MFAPVPLVAWELRMTVIVIILNVHPFSLSLQTGQTEKIKIKKKIISFFLLKTDKEILIYRRKNDLEFKKII